MSPHSRQLPRSDADVIELSLREPEAFAEVFCRHAPYVQQYAARRLGPGPAEDIVAETFLLAFRQRGRYDQGRPNALPWLYGIATHLIGSHSRAEVRQYRAFARTGADPVTELFTDRVDGVWEAMESLYPPDKKPIESWTSEPPPEVAANKVNELFLPDGPRR